MTIQTRLTQYLAKLTLVGAAFACAPACSGEGFDDVENFAEIEQALCLEQLLTPVSATASSVENSGFPAANAIDSSMTTRWSSQFSDPQWISINLGGSRRISKVVLSWEAAASKSYTLQVSPDGTNWTTVHTVTNGD